MNGSRTTDKKTKQLIVIRRIRRTTPSRAQGAWKIAYADFVTALMAFFLLMWLIGAVSLEDRLIISKYFQTPLLVALAGGQSLDINTSAITGSHGEDLTKTSRQVRAGAQLSEQVALAETDAKKLLQLQETAQLQLLKRQLELAIEGNSQLRKYKNQLLLDLTSEGLRIQIVDEQNRPMFEMGSAILQPYTVKILHEIGTTLNQVPNKIGLSGHTDAAPYPGGNKGFSNWELSAERANASRRELIEGGMDSAKVLRVVGLASSVLFNPRNPYDVNNRRISILVMNTETALAASQNSEP